MKKLFRFVGALLVGALAASIILAWYAPALATMTHRGEWVEISFDNGYVRGFGVLPNGWVCSMGVPVDAEGRRNRMTCLYIPRPWFVLKRLRPPRVPSLVIRAVDLLYLPTPFQGVHVERSHDPRTGQPYLPNIRYRDPATVEIELNQL